ncbi:MAG TPA: hypothetical protein VIM11_19215 [Tepidisphaeraceae bacterium]
MARSKKLTRQTAFGAARRFIETIDEYPPQRFEGRGVVMCAGGPKYFPCAWVCINMLRHVGCKLPIEMWSLNSREITPLMRKLVKPLDVRCVNAAAVRKRHPARILKGWELKPYAILHSRFEEVLFLDADNVPVLNPESLFTSKEYKEHGAIFWPCYHPIEPDHPIWKICRVEYRDEADFESGQMVINKSRCWRALNLAMHMNENSDFYYRFTRGDRDTFHMAWRMTGQDYAMVKTPIERLDGTACQHDLRGQRMFQHRHGEKWKGGKPNQVIPGFLLEQKCFNYLRELYR